MHATHLIPTQSSSTKPTNTIDNCTSFFGNIMGGALKVGVEKMKSDLSRRPTAPSSKQENQIIQHGENATYEYAALNIAKSSHYNLTEDDRGLLREQLGKPTTLVKLPNGDDFDTRYIMEGQHGKNNRLGDVVVKEIHDGVKSNLEIDYDFVTSDYVEANKNQLDTIVDLTEDGDKKPAAITVTPKMPRVSTEKAFRESKIQEMHERVIHIVQ